MLIRFIKDVSRTVSISPNNAFAKPVRYYFKAGEVRELPEREAKQFLERGEAKLTLPLVKPDVLKELGITPRQGKTISLPLLSKSEQEAVVSKKFGGDVAHYLKAHKDITVSDIAEVLLGVLEYAIDNKDSQTIERATRDLSVIYKLVRVAKDYKGK